MPNFFEKLKKGMDIPEETPKEEEIPTEEEPHVENTSLKGFSIANIIGDEEEAKKKPVKKSKVKIKEEEEPEKQEKPIKKEKKWFEQEGQLVIDVYQTDDEIVIQSAIAGVNPEDIDISVENDMVRISGERKNTFEKKDKNYFYQECYWGSFSREIVLPAEVDSGRADASMKNGVLTIRMPKIERGKKKITVK